MREQWPSDSHHGEPSPWLGKYNARMRPPFFYSFCAPSFDCFAHALQYPITQLNRERERPYSILDPDVLGQFIETHICHFHGYKRCGLSLSLSQPIPLFIIHVLSLNCNRFQHQQMEYNNLRLVSRYKRKPYIYSHLLRTVVIVPLKRGYIRRRNEVLII